MKFLWLGIMFFIIRDYYLEILVKPLFKAGSPKTPCQFTKVVLQAVIICNSLIFVKFLKMELKINPK